MRKLTFLLTFMLFVVFQASAQMTISGKVTNAETGEPIPGASVVVKSQTTIGTTTNMDGNYSLQGVPADAETLVFSFVGMQEKEVAINGRTTIDVELAPSVQEMEEVVVTAVGIEREKKALGYKVQGLEDEAIEKSASGDILRTLSGRTAGLEVTSSSGSAGAGSYMEIRGASSLTGNNQPLFIVDGQPVNSGGGTRAGTGFATSDIGGTNTTGRTMDINPEDIKSISILQGGAATALYGLRAANGAVVITTKKGQTGQRMKVNYTSSYGINQVSQLPARQDVFAQGTGESWISGNSTSWGPKIDNMAYSKNPSVWSNPKMDVYGALVPQSSIDGSSQYYNGPAKVRDAYDFFQNGTIFKNNLSVSSGTDASSFYLSLGHRQEEGVVPNNVSERLSVRLNSDADLTEQFNIFGRFNYVNTDGTFIQKGSNTSGVMLGLLRTPPSFDNSAGYVLEDGTQRTYRGGGGYDNPYWTANKNYYDESIHRMTGNAGFEYDATEWLSFRYQIGLDWYMRGVKDFMAIHSNASPDGNVSETRSYNSILNSDFLAKINKDLTEDISFNLTLGHNMMEDYSKGVSAYTNAGLEIPGFQHVSNTSDVSGGVSEYKLRTAALFGDMQISFMDMIFLGLSARNEWATSMPEDNLSSLYPSGNLGFVFTELPVFKGNDILSFGKLRASYAKVANIASAYALYTTYFTGGVGDGWTDGFDFPITVGSNSYTGFSYGGSLGDPNLTHEQQISAEVGLNLKFFNNRFGLDVSYFNNENKNLLMGVPIAPSTGFFQKYTNAGTMESKGWEISAYATAIKTTDFQWKIEGNFTMIDNPVKSLAPGIDNIGLSGFVVPQIRAVAGDEYRSIYGYDWIRDDNGNVVINNNPADDYRDGYPMTDESAMKSLGSVTNDWHANVTNTLSYKGLELSFTFDFRQGGRMYNGTRFAMNYFGTSKETENREVVYNQDGSINIDQTPAENITVFDGVEGYVDGDGNIVTSGETNDQRVVLDQGWYQGYGSNFGGGATIQSIEDTDWIRLKQVSLSYSLGKNLLERLPFSRASVYVTGTNLFLSTPYRGVDPNTNLTGATNGQGLDYFNMPGTKSYTLGLIVNF